MLYEVITYRDENGNVVTKTTSFDAIDKYNYTAGTGLSKPEHIIINLEQQSWLSALNVYPTREDLTDSNNRNSYNFV